MDRFGEVIKNYWFIVIFIGSLVISYTSMQFRITSIYEDNKVLSERIEKLEQKDITDALIVSQINSRLASIETSLAFLTNQFK